MKYKKLLKEQIVISLDRLTRFKNTKEKYLRVFSEILLNCLIEPQLRKSDIEKMDYAELTNMATEILNESIKTINNSCRPNVHSNDDKNGNSNVFINQIICEYENSVFYNDSDTNKLLNNNILYVEAVNLFPDDCSINLKWLKYIANFNNKNLKELREKYALKYPIEKVILVEGITEEILLPAFSMYLDVDFYKTGIQIIPAGGKNQVVKMYYKLVEEIKLPIYILLDKDAEENIKQITPKLRENDKIHLVSCGEFEDLLPKSLIVKTVNNHFENFLSISENDLKSELPTAKQLEELFKTKGLHEFKKAEFAKLVKENINENSDISDEVRNIIKGLDD